MVGLNYLVKRPKGYHHRVAAKVVSKIERGRPATSVHGFVLAVFRARACARSIMRLYQSILVNALLGREFGNGLDHGDKEHDPRVGERRFGASNGSRIDAMHAKRSITSTSTVRHGGLSTSTRGSCGRVGQRATESILINPCATRRLESRHKCHGRGYLGRPSSWRLRSTKHRYGDWGSRRFLSRASLLGRP